jgi:hypothetical protein
MTARPHSISDLQLAPVMLSLEDRLDELAALSSAELAEQVAIVGDRPEWSRGFRETGLLSTVSGPLELHDWVLSWDVRGLRVSNGIHHVTLGIPPTFDEYLGAPDSPHPSVATLAT